MKPHAKARDQNPQKSRGLPFLAAKTWSS